MQEQLISLIGQQVLINRGFMFVSGVLSRYNDVFGFTIKDDQGNSVAGVSFQAKHVAAIMPTQFEIPAIELL